MTHLLRYAARTDQGLVRSNNEDSVFAGDRLLVIADGMGGHAHGEDASRLAVAAFVPLDELPLGADMRRPLFEATRQGNRDIAEMVEAGGDEYEGMGTTLTALLFDGATAALCHVGDSRAYLYRNGVLHQISTDDTFVQQLVNEGRITPEEAAHHPQRSLLLRALNGGDLDPRITFREVSTGDRFLLCSDGLSDYVAAEAIADALAGPDPDVVADTLIQLALVAGAPDNVTVIVADVMDTGELPVTVGAAAFDDDPEATGPMQAIHDTQRMARVPLPAIPEEPGAPAEPVEGDADEDDDDFDDDDFSDDENDDETPLTGRSPQNRPRWGRRAAFALALVVLLGIGLIGTFLWTKTKYFVGNDEGQVVVYQGVNGSVLGLRFASVEENSCGAEVDCVPLLLTDLVPAAQDQVDRGIEVETIADARDVIQRLIGQELLPACSTAPATGSSSSPSTTPRPSSTAPTAVTTTGPDGVETVVVLTTVTGELTMLPYTESSGATTGARPSTGTDGPPLESLIGSAAANASTTPATPSTAGAPDPSAGSSADSSSTASSAASSRPSGPVTVTSTQTVQPSPSASAGTPTPTSPTPQVPGVTCRVVA